MTEGILFSIGEFAVHDRPGIFTMPGMFHICEVFHCAVRTGGQVPGGVARWVRALAAVVLPRLLAFGGTCSLRIVFACRPGQPYLCDRTFRDEGHRSSSYGKELTK